MAAGYYPPVGFYFVVGFNSTNSMLDGKFQEVSGISIRIDTEPITEGGESQFKHKLPTKPEPSNLVLKRGVLIVKSDFTYWVSETLSSGFQEPVKPKNIIVSLLRAEGKIMRQWVFINAWPAKWELSSMDSMGNEIFIESIEFSYNYH